MRRAAVAVLVALAAAACTEPVERVTEVLTPSPSASPTTPAERITHIEGDGVVVQTPFANGEVGPPVSVSGTADVAGALVTIRVLDEAQAELAQAVVEASCGDGCTGTFSAELFYFVPERTLGWIEVSGASSQGPPSRVRVPVVLFP